MKNNAIGDFLEDEKYLGYLLMTPALLILLIFIAYPFCLGVWLSFTDKLVGKPASFIGLKNFAFILDSQIFRRTIQNTFIFTAAATFLKFILGLALALLLNQKIPFKRLIRASCLLPWIVPTVLSCMAWLWMFDSTYSVFNWLLIKMGVIKWGIMWLGDATLAMISIIIVNVWRGTPFFAISFLAALQTVNPELYEAAALDGAGAPSKLWYITLPTIKPVIIIVMLLSIVWTFADFQVVYALTRGGPYNSTHLFATLAYQIGLDSGALGRGSAIALFMFPLLAIIVSVQLWYLRRSE
jgi:multiple sugar transport system permease protein